MRHSYGVEQIVVAHSVVGEYLVQVVAAYIRKQDDDNFAPVFRQLAIGLVTAGTMLASCLFFLFAPQHAIGHWARVTMLTTLYNAVLALPLYFIIRWLAGASEDSARKTYK